VRVERRRHREVKFPLQGLAGWIELQAPRLGVSLGKCPRAAAGILDAIARLAIGVALEPLLPAGVSMGLGYACIQIQPEAMLEAQCALMDGLDARAAASEHQAAH
jgi:hypothetical protein